jgi:hypothetical protein
MVASVVLTISRGSTARAKLRRSRSNDQRSGIIVTALQAMQA